MGTDGGRRDEVPLVGPDIYVAAVTYPAECDWRNLEEGVSAPWENLLLLHGLDTVCCIRTGVQNRIPSDPSHIHIIEGHLFTTYTAGGSTSVSRDGQMLFSYSGEEEIVSILHDGAALLTLGRGTDGEGFSLRKDGTELYSSEDASLVVGAEGPGVRALDMADGLPVFTFLRQGDNGEKEWMLYKDGAVEKILMPAEAGEVYGVRLLGGHLYMVLSLKDGEAPVLAVDSDCYRLGYTISYDDLYDFGLAAQEDDMLIYGSYRQHFTGHIRSDIFDYDVTACWGRESLSAWYYGMGYLYRSGTAERFVRLKEGRVFMISWPPRSTRLDYRMEGDYTMFGYDCGTLRDTTLYMGLTPLHAGEKPLIWMGGLTREVNVNGYITAISVEE